MIHTLYHTGQPWTKAERDWLCREWYGTPMSVLIHRLSRSQADILGEANRMGMPPQGERATADYMQEVRKVAQR